MRQLKQDREFNEVTRKEIELANSFAEGSYRSYKAKNKKKPPEKK